MFLVMLTYKKPLSVVDQHLANHRAFLDTGYQKNCFVVSGPANPRTRGIILSQLRDRAELESLIKQDPFYINDVADYEIIEFDPVKFHTDFARFLP